jgi:serine protease DegQ
MRGEVIGINSAIVGPSEGNVGIGLAVPSNTARSVMDAIVSRAGVPASSS